MKIAFFELPESKKQEYIKLLEGSGLGMVFFEEKLSNSNLDQVLDVDILYVFVNSILNQEVLSKLPNLKFIVTGSTGYDHIDINYCNLQNIKVSSVPAYGSQTVAEFTFALILNLSRRVYLAYNKLKDDGDFNIGNFVGFDLENKTIGVIGTGKIGKHIIKIASGFGMNIVAYDLYPDIEFASQNNFKYLSLDELLSSSDIVTLHAPYTKDNHHLLNKENLSKIKKGAFLVNTARGELIETQALIVNLLNGNIAGAGLDVLESERDLKNENEILISENDPGNYKILLENRALIDMPNVIVTPHIAFYTKEAEHRIMDTVVSNILGFLKNEPVNLVK